MMYGCISYLCDRVHCTIASLDSQDVVTRSLLELVEDHLTYEVHDAQGTLVLTDPSFGNLVSSVESTYHLLCLEFFASMEMDIESIDYADEKFISFRVGGVRRYCSLFEFGRRLGLYPAPAAESLEFQHHLATSLSTSVQPSLHRSPLPRQVYLLSYFITCLLVIIISLFSTRVCPLIALLPFSCRLIISHILHRRDTDKMNLQDLFYLWCFHSGRSLNLPLVLAIQLRRRGGSRCFGSPIL